MSPALPVVSGAEVLRALGRGGFTQVSQKGSHVKLRKESPTGSLTVDDLLRLLVQ